MKYLNCWLGVHLDFGSATLLTMENFPSNKPKLTIFPVFKSFHGIDWRNDGDDDDDTCYELADFYFIIIFFFLTWSDIFSSRKMRYFTKQKWKKIDSVNHLVCLIIRLLSPHTFSLRPTERNDRILLDDSLSFNFSLRNTISFAWL